MRSGLVRVVVIQIAPAVSLAEAAALRELNHRLKRRFGQLNSQMPVSRQTIPLGAAAP